MNIEIQCSCGETLTKKFNPVISHGTTHLPKLFMNLFCYSCNKGLSIQKLDIGDSYIEYAIGDWVNTEPIKINT